jgi:hypothetical protein
MLTFFIFLVTLAGGFVLYRTYQSCCHPATLISADLENVVACHYFPTGTQCIVTLTTKQDFKIIIPLKQIDKGKELHKEITNRVGEKYILIVDTVESSFSFEPLLRD